MSPNEEIMEHIRRLERRLDGESAARRDLWKAIHQNALHIARIDERTSVSPRLMIAAFGVIIALGTFIVLVTNP